MLEMYIGIFIIGLFVGSFYNVVALRTLSGESVAFPPSHCANCNHRLGPLDLIPVFSYVFIGGKCRYCKKKISPLYPIGELLTALSFVIVLWRFKFSFDLIINLVFVSVMAIATVSDLKETLVPDRYFVIGCIITLILRIINKDDLGFYMFGSVFSFVFMYLIYIFSNEGLGGADVKIYALIGLNMGAYDSMMTLAIASIIGILVMLPVMKIKKLERKFEIPFFPFITVGVLVVFIINGLGFSLI